MGTDPLTHPMTQFSLHNKTKCSKMIGINKFNCQPTHVERSASYAVTILIPRTTWCLNWIRMYKSARVIRIWMKRTIKNIISNVNQNKAASRRGYTTPYHIYAPHKCVFTYFFIIELVFFCIHVALSPLRRCSCAQPLNVGLKTPYLHLMAAHNKSPLITICNIITKSYRPPEFHCIH